jgi:hypothetical protein
MMRKRRIYGVHNLNSSDKHGVNFRQQESPGGESPARRFLNSAASGKKMELGKMKGKTPASRDGHSAVVVKE